MDAKGEKQHEYREKGTKIGSGGEERRKRWEKTEETDKRDRLLKDRQNGRQTGSGRIDGRCTQMIHTDRRTDTKSAGDLIPTLTDSLAGVGGRRRRTTRRKERSEEERRSGERKKFRCLGFHTVNLAVWSAVAPFSHSSSLLSLTC